MLQLLSPNFNKRNKKINSIIIHYTELSKEDTIQRFMDRNSEVSSHYLIDKKGEVILFVQEKDRAWHSGVSFFKNIENFNDNSIGIEIENNGKELFKEEQYQTLIKLITTLKKKYPLIKNELIIGHSDVAPQRKDDPGKYFDWKKLAEHNIGIYLPYQKSAKIIAKFGDKNNEVTKLQKNLQKFGYQIKIDGFFYEKTQKIIIAFKNHYHQESLDNLWTEGDNKQILKLLEKFLN